MFYLIFINISVIRGSTQDNYEIKEHRASLTQTSKRIALFIDTASATYACKRCVSTENLTPELRGEGGGTNASPLPLTSEAER